MEATKKLNGKAVTKWLSNNAIIVMMLAVSLIVGIMHPNFFSGTVPTPPVVETPPMVQAAMASSS